MSKLLENREGALSYFIKQALPWYQKPKIANKTGIATSRREYHTPVPSWTQTWEFLTY